LGELSPQVTERVLQQSLTLPVLASLGHLSQRERDRLSSEVQHPKK